MFVTPPTDNLYKFLCVLGLAMMVAAGGAMIRATENMDKGLEALLVATQEYRTAARELIEGTAAWKEKARSYGGWELMSPDQRAEVFALVDATDEPGRRFHKLQEATNGQQWLYEKRVLNYELVRRLCVAGGLCGAVLFGFGLFYWYRRVQLRADLQTAEKEHKG